ncbi:copper amine oxidase [Planococcus sp. 1R117A]|uniref:copper amine oxidase n=1 Tax=Planococcus sp. 1R117A TaxID=3447020 RepID=UPI003EDC0562
MKAMNKATTLLLILVMLIPVGGGAALADSHQSEVATVDTAALEMRSEIDRLLSEHGFGTITLMRKIFNKEPDVEQLKELANLNSQDLRAGFASVYGEGPADEFIALWNEHNALFVEYATAAANNDQQAMQNAMDKMEQGSHKIAALQAEVSEGKLPEAAVAEMLMTHEQQVKASFDAYVAGDYPTSYAMQSEAMAYLVNTMSKTLSTAYAEQFPELYDNSKALTVAGNLRSDLNLLLGEHFAVAGTVMHKRFQDAPDFEASLAALNANTGKVAAAITSIYGEEAGNQFAALWNSHNEYYLQYVDAVKNNNAEEKEAAVANLGQFRDEFSQFMSTATEGILDVDTVSEALQMHVDTTLGTFDSFVAGDYAKAWTTAREGYTHMFATAKLFSAAFVQQFPDKFAGVPAMPETGQGGMAHMFDMNSILWSLPFLIIAALLVFSRRKVLE